MNKHLNISKDFAAPKWEDWKQLVIDSLKGADYDKAMKTKTYDGITLQPIYRREDIQDLPFKQSEPGSAPYLRGNDPQQRIDEGWKDLVLFTRREVHSSNDSKITLPF
ncbi:MAG: methylmalonyl-CoA mutase family protein [Candidatus Cloacimonetes bacterium]|nr:methylmalonyl-CoA mutase family protein [Candidatus Cloacimonadota bacterium]